MKKVLIFTLVLALSLFVFVSCKNNKTGSETKSDTTSKNETTSESTIESTSESESESTTQSESETETESTTTESLLLYEYDLKEYLNIGQYKDVNVSQKAISEKLEMNIRSLLLSFATTAEVTDRAIKDGDIIDMEYSGRLFGEDEPFAGGAGRERNFIIGNNNFIPGFNEGLIGRGLGEDKEFDIEVTFPENYHAKEFAGKKAIFTIKVITISEYVLPELDDAFLNENTQFSTVDELRTRITKEIKANIVVETVLSNFSVKKYPEKEFNAKYNKFVGQYEDYATMMGMTLENFLSIYFGMTLEDFLIEVTAEIEKQLKQEMVFYYIIREENITLSDEEFNKEALFLAKSTGVESIGEFLLLNRMTEETLRQHIHLRQAQFALADWATLVNDTN